MRFNRVVIIGKSPTPFHSLSILSLPNSRLGAEPPHKVSKAGFAAESNERSAGHFRDCLNSLLRMHWDYEQENWNRRIGVPASGPARLQTNEGRPRRIGVRRSSSWTARNGSRENSRRGHERKLSDSENYLRVRCEGLRMLNAMSFHDQGSCTSPVLDYLHELHRKFAAAREGTVATYIPELAKANPDWFGICLVTAGGEAY